MHSPYNEFVNLPLTERRELARERLSVAVTEKIAALMKESGTKKADLARRLDCSRTFVTKILRGNHNFTLDTLSDVFVALDHCVQVEAVPTACLQWVPLCISAQEVTSGSWEKKEDWVKPMEKTTGDVAANSNYALAA